MNFKISKNEHLQSIREFYTLYDIKHKYPKNLLTKVLTEHQKMFINFIVFVEYYSEFLFLHDNTYNEEYNSSCSATEILLCDTPCTNIRNKIKEIEKYRLQIFKT